jgi:putative phosphoribosyl transferase
VKSAFKNRQEAGRLLAEFLKTWSLDKHATVILALPRGGVVVGYEISKALHVPLDVLVVEKIGHPLHPEYNISGADQSMNSLLLNYRKTHPLPLLQNKTVILVDDGITTGITAMVAAESIKAKGAAKVILASPACAKRTAQKLKANFEDVACLIEPTKFISVAHFYKNFEAVSEAEVIQLLLRAQDRMPQDILSDDQTRTPESLVDSQPRTNGSFYSI